MKQEDNSKQTGTGKPLYDKEILPTICDQNIYQTPFNLHDFSTMCMEASYVIDFLKGGFQYVADRDFFLCGHSVDDVKIRICLLSKSATH